MARGSLIKRCPVCRGKKKPENHQCSRHEISYYAVYWVDKKQKWKFAGHKKREAEVFLKQKLAEIDNGTYRERKKVLFKDFAEMWLENVPKPRVKASTFRGYVTDVKRHLTPYFGERYVEEIHQEQVERFLSNVMQKKGRGRNKCNKNLDPKTVNNIRLTLRMILDYARRLKYILENPVSEVKPYKVEKGEADCLHPKEIPLFLKHSREPFRTMFLVAIFTGMRRAELLAFQWGDVDWNRNMIFIRRSLYRWTDKKSLSSEKRWKFVSPKTKRSVRAVTLTPMLKKALEIHRINSPVNAYDLVFANNEGQPIDGDNMYKREFLPTLSMAGIRRIRFQDLRHTFASLLIAKNGNAKLVQSQMGHASIQTTMDTYGHLFPIDHKLAGEELDNLVFGNPSNKNLTSVGQVPTNNAKDTELEVASVK